MAWVRVAMNKPDVTFFGYTKHIAYVTASRIIDLPNFKLVYSFGGKDDGFLRDEPTCYAVNSIEEARVLGVPVACLNNPADDFTRIMNGESFAILIHGTQPKGYKKGKR
jgi:hypothetical protein